MFKKLLFILLMIGLFLSVNAQTRTQDYENIVWDNGTTTSNTLVASALTDTTSEFKFKQGRDFPEYISFFRIAIEGTNSDSCSVSYTLDLSNEGTYWYAWGVLGGDSLTSVATAATTVTGSATVGINPASTSLSLMPTYNFGRVRAASAVAASTDTVTCKLQMVRGFIQ